MKLLTKAIENKLPALNSTEHIQLDDKICQVKFFNPCGSWTWYAVEYDPIDKIFFGWVDGQFPEWGLFALDELQEYRGQFGLGIERDMHFPPTQMKNITDYQKRGM
jgi:hypothetical protein